jgi:hypothetical protein
MKKVLFMLLLSSFFISSAAVADVPAEQVAEVQHLIDFIKNSNCIMDRNGTEHSSVDAISHIQRKYDYFRDDIESTEDFIRLSATKSTMSGSYYTVICPDKTTIRSQDWLMNELKKYRSQKK